jgi:hypothetical protein
MSSEMTVCKFDTCSNPIYSQKHSLCTGHYSQWCRRGELRPLRGTPEWRSISVVNDEKTCTRCGYLLPTSNFYAKGESNGIRAHCNRCNILRRMNMTARDFDRLLAEQGGGCAICGRTDPQASGRAFAVDHDHACCPGSGSCGKCVRGILCDDCNVAIGRFHDDVRVMARAIAYLNG